MQTTIRTFFNPIRQINRSYRAHVIDDKHISLGRSIIVKNNAVSGAFRQLRQVITDSRLREISRYQERFERPTDKRRRKKKEGLFKKYIEFKRAQISKAFDLKKQGKDANTAFRSNVFK